MQKKAQVTSKISTKVEWEDDEHGLSTGYVGDLQHQAPEDGTFIDLEERVLYVKGVAQKHIVPFGSTYKYSGNIWRPTDCGYDDPKHLIEDYKRFMTYQKHEWSYRGCIAKVTLEVKTICEKGVYRINTMVIGQDSLWGIESDCGEGYQKEVEADCLEAAKLEAREVLQAIRDMTEEEINALFDENVC